MYVEPTGDVRVVLRGDGETLLLARAALPGAPRHVPEPAPRARAEGAGRRVRRPAVRRPHLRQAKTPSPLLPSRVPPPPPGGGEQETRRAHRDGHHSRPGTSHSAAAGRGPGGCDRAPCRKATGSPRSRVHFGGAAGGLGGATQHPRQKKALGGRSWPEEGTVPRRPRRRHVQDLRDRRRADGRGPPRHRSASASPSRRASAGASSSTSRRPSSRSRRRSRRPS